MSKTISITDAAHEALVQKQIKLQADRKKKLTLVDAFDIVMGMEETKQE